MDEETKQAIQDAEQRAKDFATGLKDQYTKKDAWFQASRRLHPLRWQNGMLFGGLIVGALVGYFVK